MEKDMLQAAVLSRLLHKQKLCIKDKEFLKKLTFVLGGTNKQYYRKKLKELSELFNVSGILIMSNRFHHALCYICITEYVIKEMKRTLEKDFEVIVHGNEQFG